MDMGSLSILHSGWLQKMPHANHTFSKGRRRWFVLRTKDDRSLLEYFNEPSSTKAKGSIDLSQCRSITPEGETRGRHFSFILKTSERQYNLSADSFDDYKTWISRIADASGIPNPLPQIAKRSAPAPLKLVPAQESGGGPGGGGSSGPRTADGPAAATAGAGGAAGAKADKETSPYIPISECRTGAKWTSADRTSPDPIMDEMRRVEMNNNLAARPPPPSAATPGSGAGGVGSGGASSQFNYDIPRAELATYSVPKPLTGNIVVADTSAYSVPRPLTGSGVGGGGGDLQQHQPAATTTISGGAQTNSPISNSGAASSLSCTAAAGSATYSVPKATPVPLDILTKSPPPPSAAAVSPPDIRTDHYLVPTNNAALVPSEACGAVLGADALSYDMVPPPVNIVDAPPRPPKPRALRGPLDSSGHSVGDDGAYDVPAAQGGGTAAAGGNTTAGQQLADSSGGSASRIYGNSRDMNSSCSLTSTAPPSAAAISASGQQAATAGGSACTELAGGGFLPDSTELINAVPPAVNRTLKPRKQSHEPITPPSSTAQLSTSVVPRRITTTTTTTCSSSSSQGNSGGPSAPPPVPTRNSNNGNSNNGGATATLNNNNNNSNSAVSNASCSSGNSNNHNYNNNASNSSSSSNNNSSSSNNNNSSGSSSNNNNNSISNNCCGGSGGSANAGGGGNINSGNPSPVAIQATGGPQHFFPHDFRKPSLVGNSPAVTSAASVAAMATGGGPPPPGGVTDSMLLLSDGDGRELQYLDLGNGEPSTPSPRTPGSHGAHSHSLHHHHHQHHYHHHHHHGAGHHSVSTPSGVIMSSQTCPPTSSQAQSTAIEYKELDFVKTKALNETRQNVNKTYRAQLEEAH